MSFSSDVKKELLGQVPRSRHCQLAELAGIINMDGAIDKDTGCLVLESNIRYCFKQILVVVSVRLY
mgnify:CR=1 FL=1